MIKDIDNAIVVSADVKSGEEATIKCCDLVFFDDGVITETVGTATTTFGIVADDNEGDTKRLVLINGIVSVNLAAGTYKQGDMIVMDKTAKNFKIGTDNTKVNGVYIKDNLVYIFNNLIYTLSQGGGQ